MGQAGGRGRRSLVTTLYRVQTLYSGIGSGSGLTTMYFIKSGALTAQNAANAVTTFWSNVRGLQSTLVTEQVLQSVDEIDSTSGQVTGSNIVTSTPQTGTLSDNALPWATQLQVRWTTGFYIGGRQLIGKTYIPGLTEATANATWLAGTLSAVLGNCSTLIADPNSELAVFSPTYGLGQIVTGVFANSTPAVLRSRRS